MSILGLGDNPSSLSVVYDVSLVDVVQQYAVCILSLLFIQNKNVARRKAAAAAAAFNAHAHSGRSCDIARCTAVD